MNILIPTPNFPETAAVAAAFDTLDTAIATATQAGEARKEAYGNLCESADFIPPEPDGKLYGHDRTLRFHQIATKTRERLRRRVLFYAAELRLMRAFIDLQDSRSVLVAEVEKLRLAIEKPRPADEQPRPEGTADIDDTGIFELDAAICNLLLATTLCLQAYQLAAQLRRLGGYFLHPNLMYLPGDKKVDLRELIVGELNRLRREYVIASGAHGSSLRFDGGDGTVVPSGPYLTLDEADWQCGEIIGHGCTVGAQAQPFNVRTDRAK